MAEPIYPHSYYQPNCQEECHVLQQLSNWKVWEFEEKTLHREEFSMSQKIIRV